jgi:5'-nucleotidase
MLEKQFPSEVDLLKVDVPSNATRQTDWQVTRLARQRYFIPVAPKRKSWEERGPVDYQEAANLDNEREDSDVYVLRVKRLVSLTPLSLDFTARVDFEELNRLLRGDD